MQMSLLRQQLGDPQNQPFDEESFMPDGELWTPYTDMSRFTNPDHKAFWQPNWVKQLSL